ncbi:unnamed protein product [Urochloa decumbens]|uniref:DUF1618 domain-containing protein n=2 Tax=Urochloa decumbens TaxID=240449 RepID=A0ABC9CQB1_9POAL
MSAAAAEGFPKWVLLERYLFRRDKDSFPDKSKAPIRASATTSWGADFSIAFSVVEPPRISRLYAHMPTPAFPHPDKELPLLMLATHRHLALFMVSSSQVGVQNFFIFRADEKNPSSSLLKLLPTCTEPEIDYSRGGDRLRPRYLPSNATPSRRQPSNATPRPRLMTSSLGLWCGDKEELVVAELTVFVPTRDRHCTKAFADICLLRSSFTGDQLGGEWGSMRVPILTDNHDNLMKLARWQTNAIIPFKQWLCWIDYRQAGILFCDLSSKVHDPTISFLRFPLLNRSPLITSTHKSPLTTPYKTTCNTFYGGVSVVDHGRLLKFVNVARYDGLVYKALKPGAGFTITCHTLVLGDGSMEWKEDYTITSHDLHELPPGIPMFPRVDMDRPHVVHFHYIEFGSASEKMWVLSIDMSTKTVESFYLYMDVNVYLKVDKNSRLQMEDADFFRSIRMSPTPSPFLPCEFPRFCYLSRKRKDME